MKSAEEECFVSLYSKRYALFFEISRLYFSFEQFLRQLPQRDDYNPFCYVARDIARLDNVCAVETFRKRGAMLRVHGRVGKDLQECFPVREDISFGLHAHDDYERVHAGVCMLYDLMSLENEIICVYF